MEHIRVVMAWLPRMLLEILQRAAVAMGMDVTVLAVNEDFARTVVRSRAHAVVLGQVGGVSEALVRALLDADERLCVMTVSESGKHATVRRLNSAALTLENNSPHDLLATLEVIALRGQDPRGESELENRDD
jgi:hypothetical protein